MCVVYAFKDFHEKKNNALDFKNVENKNKIKQNQKSGSEYCGRIF